MLHRRHILAASLAGLAMPGAFASPASARAPLAAKQVAGIYRRKVGQIEVTAILDGFIPLNLDVFPGAPVADLTRILASQGLTPNLPTAVNAFVINTGERTVLVDTGLGSNPAFGPTLGRLADNLVAAGVQPAQVDAVILTHIHPDHSEGLLQADRTARFPNAELIVAESEAAYWTDQGITSRAPDGMKPFFASAQGAIAPYAARTRKVQPGEVFPGISLISAPGHTPGHSLVRISSGPDQLILIGDIIANAAIHTARPQTPFVFDGDPALAAQSRVRVFDMISTDGILIAGSHIAFPGFGRVLKDGAAYKFVPADWSYDL